MTYGPKPDKETVIAESHIRGVADDFYSTVPDEFNAASTGGASAGAGSTGLSLSCGATTDDEATLTGPNLYSLRNLPMSVYEMLISPSGLANSSTPSDSHMRAGFGLDSSNWTGDAGLMLDLKNEQINYEGTTRALDASISDFGLVLFRAEVDHQNNETTVIVQNETVYRQVEVFNSANVQNNAGIAITRSNGINESLEISAIALATRQKP